MEFWGRVVEKFPLWNSGVFLAFSGVSIWLLTRLDELTRRHVELSRHLWEATSTHEIEFVKIRSGGRLFLIFCTILNLAFSIIIVCAYVLVRR